MTKWSPWFCITSYGVADQGHWLETNSQQYKQALHKKEKANFMYYNYFLPWKEVSYQ